MALAETVPTSDGADYAFDCNNFQIPLGTARGFECKASMLNCKKIWQVAAVKRTENEIKSIISMASKEFAGTRLMNMAMRTINACSSCQKSGGWFWWRATFASVKLFSQP
jgi:hypothetical protein